MNKYRLSISYPIIYIIVCKYLTFFLKNQSHTKRHIKQSRIVQLVSACNHDTGKRQRCVQPCVSCRVKGGSSFAFLSAAASSPYNRLALVTTA